MPIPHPRPTAATAAAAAAAAVAAPLPPAMMPPIATAGTFGALVTTGFLLHQARVEKPPWMVPQLPAYVEARHWEPGSGSVLVGVTDPGPATETHDGWPFAVWTSDPHMLMTGSTGAGKSAAVRWAALSLVASGYRIAGFDGKGSGLMRPLEGREGVVGVADDPGEWTELVNTVHTEMDGYYEQLRAFRAGRGSRPRHVGIAVLADELVDIIDQLGRAFLYPLSEIIRMGREADIRVMASVLRPDVADSLPGLVKTQMRARLALGCPTRTAGRMLFEDDWPAVRAVMDSRPPPGRGVALLSGHPYRVQLPWTTDPADGEPDAAALLPPRPEPPAPADRRRSAHRAAVLRGESVSWRTVAETLTAEGHHTIGGGPWTAAAARRITEEAE